MAQRARPIGVSGEMVSMLLVHVMRVLCEVLFLCYGCRVSNRSWRPTGVRTVVIRSLQSNLTEFVSIWAPVRVERVVPAAVPDTNVGWLL